MMSSGQGMKKRYEIIWSKESKRQFDHIVAYLRAQWTQKEVDRFVEKLRSFEKLVVEFPDLYEESKQEAKPLIPNFRLQRITDRIAQH